MKNIFRTSWTSIMQPRKNMLRRVRILLSLFLLTSVLLFSQQGGLDLGPARFVSMPAPMLMNPDHLSIGLKKHTFVVLVGGVAFDQIAKPASSLALHSVAIGYDRTNPDGTRLSLSFDGKKVVAPLYDWQLVPIARFAASEYYSCFTLFGKLNNATQQKNILAEKDRILNYHPAFFNTLLGLRLMQLDMLILYQFCSDLPKANGAYILGEAEPTPVLRENERGFMNFYDHRIRIQNDLNLTHRSYVICDYGRDIQFDTRNDTLSITGDPFYYCWRLRSDSVGYSVQNVGNEITNEIKHSMEKERASRGDAFNERAWYIDALIAQLKLYDGNYQFYEKGPLVEILKLPNDSTKRAFLNRYDTQSIRTVLVDMKVNMHQFEPVYLQTYSERLSSRPDLFRAVNPNVWDAATTTMRYGAFFRYVKQEYPDAWERFVAEIQNVSIQPAVETPTVMRLPDSMKK